MRGSSKDMDVFCELRGTLFGASVLAVVLRTAGWDWITIADCAVTHGQSDCHPDEGESVDHANVGTDDVATAYERAYKRSKSCSVATAFELSDGHVRGAANRG